MNLKIYADDLLNNMSVVKYGFTEAVRIGIAEYLKLNILTKDYDGESHAGMVAKMINNGLINKINTLEYQSQLFKTLTAQRE